MNITTKVYSTKEICLKLRYEFEDEYAKEIRNRKRFKAYKWRIFLNEKLRLKQINKYIYDICLEEFLNSNYYIIKEVK